MKVALVGFAGTNWMDLIEHATIIPLEIRLARMPAEISKLSQLGLVLVIER